MEYVNTKELRAAARANPYSFENNREACLEVWDLVKKTHTCTRSCWINFKDHFDLYNPESMALVLELTNNDKAQAAKIVVNAWEYKVCPRCETSNNQDFFEQSFTTFENSNWDGLPRAKENFAYFCRKCNVKSNGVGFLQYVEFVKSQKDPYWEARDGSSSDDMEKLATLAKQGHASALAAFTWKCIFEGNFQRAITLYDTTRQSLNYSAGGPDTLIWELANVDSNHALNLLGSGKDLEEVGFLWTDNELSGNPESSFYATIFRIKTKEASVSSLYNLPLIERQEIVRILREGSVESNGWYRKWCSDLLSEFGSYLEPIK